MAIHNPTEVACFFLGMRIKPGAGQAGVGLVAVNVVERRKVVVDVYLLLARDGRVLLTQRDGTGYGDGAYEPPSGQLADRETIVETAVRIGANAGIVIESDAVTLAHVMHDVSGGGRIAFFLAVPQWEGEPATARWFPFGELPTNMLDRARVALRHYAAGLRFSTYPAFGPAHLASLTPPPAGCAGPFPTAITGPTGPLAGRSALRRRQPVQPERRASRRTSSACSGSSGPAR
jgi:8-oxo-dGTP diphosphatase